MRIPRAVVLLSGGLDSYTAAAIARAEGFSLYALTVRYGQRHGREIDAARQVAAALGVAGTLEIDLDLRGIGGSALTSDHAGAARARCSRARHSVDLRSGAQHDLSVAGARLGGSARALSDLVIGVNALDYSGYPDCRPEFIAAFESLARLATRAGVEGGRFTIHTPLISLSKADIIRRGAGAWPRLRADPQLLRSAQGRLPAARATAACFARRDSQRRAFPIL